MIFYCNMNDNEFYLSDMESKGRQKTHAFFENYIVNTEKMCYTNM